MKDTVSMGRGVIVTKGGSSMGPRGGSVESIPDPGRGGSGGIYTVNFGGIWD